MEMGQMNAKKDMEKELPITDAVELPNKIRTGKAPQCWQPINHSVAPCYSEHDNPKYQRGMFIDTRCNKSKIHSYREMKGLLEELQKKYSSDVEMFPAGKSEGYGSPNNALDVWGLHLFATEKPERTAFFVAGHHLLEWTGSETVYELAKRTLESHYTDQKHLQNLRKNVQNLRKNTHLVFFPQVDADQYDNLEQFKLGDETEYFIKAYSRLIGSEDYLFVDLFGCPDVNYYGSREKHEKDFGYPPLSQSTAVKNAIQKSIDEFGSPFLAIDYHEGADKYAVMHVNNRDPPLWVLAAVSRWYPVADESSLQSGVQSEEDIALALYGYPRFSDLMVDEGAASFYTETPLPMMGDPLAEDREMNTYPLEQRIEMNLIATDRILARYFWGV